MLDQKYLFFSVKCYYCCTSLLLYILLLERYWCNSFFFFFRVEWGRTTLIYFITSSPTMGIEVPWKGLKTFFGGSEMISRRGVRNFINLCSSYQLSGLVVRFLIISLHVGPWPRPCCRSLHVRVSLRLSPLLPFSLCQPAERLLPSPPASERRRALEGLLRQHAGHHPAPAPTKLHTGTHEHTLTHKPTVIISTLFVFHYLSIFYDTDVVGHQRENQRMLSP